ncbi:hypothetical protein QI155_10625 [Thermodesulfovibrio sp. 1176]|nr:hypothetical protein [Thermodesulfovibrio sp. 1176]MDI1472986.1 hypothetical protein [Thermodesulfovibrio sp. 1176]
MRKSFILFLRGKGRSTFRLYPAVSSVKLGGDILTGGWRQYL